jgi:hypothetical protein
MCIADRRGAEERRENRCRIDSIARGPGNFLILSAAAASTAHESAAGTSRCDSLCAPPRLRRKPEYTESCAVTHPGSPWMTHDGVRLVKRNRPGDSRGARKETPSPLVGEGWVRGLQELRNARGPARCATDGCWIPAFAGMTVVGHPQPGFRSPTYRRLSSLARPDLDRLCASSAPARLTDPGFRLSPE